MPNKNYLAGRRFEYQVKEALEKMGWTIIRSSGSKGLFDLVGVKFESVDKKINFWNYQLHIGFWQLKKHIPEHIADMVRGKIVNKLTKTIQAVGIPRITIYNNFVENSEDCFVCIKDERTKEEKYIMVSFGVIYTTFKKKKK
jgi:hypothetical protein